jgi:hypothetical protein
MWYVMRCGTIFDRAELVMGEFKEKTRTGHIRPGFHIAVLIWYVIYISGVFLITKVFTE